MTTPPLDPPQPNPPLPPDAGLPAPSPVPPEPQPPGPSPVPEPGPPQPEPAMRGPVTCEPADAAADRHHARGPRAGPPSDEMPRPAGLAVAVGAGSALARR